MLPQLENLRTVALTLEGIRERFVFAGAGILPLLLDNSFSGNLRQTKDTDVVVPVVHYGEWSRLRDALIDRGFRERADDAAPRQILFWLGELQVDFIPVRMDAFGTRNSWLSLGLDYAEADDFFGRPRIFRLSAACWLAAKIAAFEQRGRADVLMSKDLEDIVTLVIGRATLADDVRSAPLEFRRFIENTFQAWRTEPMVWDAIVDVCPKSFRISTLSPVLNRIASRTD